MAYKPLTLSPFRQSYLLHVVYSMRSRDLFRKYRVGFIHPVTNNTTVYNIYVYYNSYDLLK